MELSTVELKLECVKMAAARSSVSDVVAAAQAYYDFIVGDAVKTESGLVDRIREGETR